MLIVELLIPVTGHAIAIAPTEPVRALKAAVRAAMAAAADGGRASTAVVVKPAASEPGFEHELRLVHDGVELSDDGATLSSCGLVHGSRLVAIDRRTRRGLVPRLLRLLWRWLPLCTLAILLTLLLVEATRASAGTCAPPLLLFVSVCAPILLPYGLVLSGLFQPETGHRMLWFLHSRALTRLVGASALLAFGWLIAGGVWLFGDAADECRAHAPELYAASLAAWCALALVNAPWLVLLTLPCCLLAKCECAFALVAHMAGIHRRPDLPREHLQHAIADDAVVR